MPGRCGFGLAIRRTGLLVFASLSDPIGQVESSRPTHPFPGSPVGLVRLAGLEDSTLALGDLSYNGFTTCLMPKEIFLMSITVEAIYENGVLKPAQPLPLREHEKVQVTVEPTRQSLAERIAAHARALPQETLDRLPADGASQHDHYIYGTPKRPG
jgi:predicted DNA-binding antitoxin AbrB/MazE fold protein